MFLTSYNYYKQTTTKSTSVKFSRIYRIHIWTIQIVARLNLYFVAIESGVDMRGEVALLTRNIKISGVQQRGCPAENGDCNLNPKEIDVYGGHIKVMILYLNIFICLFSF
jgi:hypothetical protein